MMAKCGAVISEQKGMGCGEEETVGSAAVRGGGWKPGKCSFVPA